ncbi:MAG: nucleoside triphosphate pyrophosphohydrolase [Gemmatimonadales bacterium]|nr:nucleoside triphosphate pyrophosphohydrolase [Gemmatimonadales bacterium]
MQDEPGGAALERVMALVRDLRQRCPWDRVQTRATLRPYLLEEAHELDHALAAGDPARIRGELGDLLLNVAYQMVLLEELGEGTAALVADQVIRKMERRHPHLFDLGPPEPWEALKRREADAPGGALDGVPPTLPALLHAERLQARAAAVGFDWADAAGPLAKVREELAEVEQAIASGDEDALADEMGDLFFSAVNLSRKAGVRGEQALERANAKFRARFAAVEALARARGLDVATAGLEVLDGLWDEVKRASLREGDRQD